MEEKLHRRWVKIGGKKGSIFDGNFHIITISGFPCDMNFKHICFLSVLFLFISGCISNENKAQDNATNLDGDQPIASKNSYNPDFKVITIETWDERYATVESDGDLIYKRDGSYYSRNLETNKLLWAGGDLRHKYRLYER